MITLYDLRQKHAKEIETFIKNCKHQYEDGNSAIKRHINDEDVCDDDGNILYPATFEEWDECEICGTQTIVK